MGVQHLPCVGDKMFLEQREVVITNVYAAFHLVEICYADTDLAFYVDASALTFIPDRTLSISIKYFGRSNDEQNTNLH